MCNKYNCIQILGHGMLPYFYNLGKRIISDEATNEIVRLSLEHYEDFKEYWSYDILHDGNHYLTKSFLSTNKYVQELIDSFTIKSWPILIMQKPYKRLVRHKDDLNNGTTTIITPLLPRDNFPPLSFYDEDDNHVVDCKFDNFNSCVVNSQEFHDLANYDKVRLNIQLRFGIPFHQTMEMIKNNTFFK